MFWHTEQIIYILILSAGNLGLCTHFGVFYLRDFCIWQPTSVYRGTIQLPCWPCDLDRWEHPLHVCISYIKALSPLDFSTWLLFGSPFIWQWHSCRSETHKSTQPSWLLTGPCWDISIYWASGILADQNSFAHCFSLFPHRVLSTYTAVIPG